jgi:hypothetical protein
VKLNLLMKLKKQKVGVSADGHLAVRIKKKFDEQE